MSMGNLVFTADVQLHSYTSWAHIGEDGRNSRLLHGIRALDYAVKAAEGGTLVILGDLFEDRRSLGIDVIDAASEWVGEAAGKLRRLVLVAGNHDQFYRTGKVTALKALAGGRSNVQVVEGFWSGYLHGFSCALAAFNPDPAVVAEWIAGQPDADILGVHQAILGAQADGGFLYEKGDALRVADLHPDRFKTVLAGHFHKPQSLTHNVHYLGSPYQIGPSEAGEEKTIAVFNAGADPKPTFKVVQGVPRFIKCSLADYDPAACAGQLVEVTVPHARRDDHGLETGPTVRVRIEASTSPSGAAESQDQAAVEACATSATATAEWLRRRNREDLVSMAHQYLVKAG